MVKSEKTTSTLRANDFIDGHHKTFHLFSCAFSECWRRGNTGWAAGNPSDLEPLTMLSDATNT